MSDSLRSAALSACSYERSRFHQSPKFRPTPAQLSIPAPASGGSRSWTRHPFSTQPSPRDPFARHSQSRHLSGTWLRTRAPSATQSRSLSAARSSSRASSSTCSRSRAPSPTHLTSSAWLPSEWLRASSNRSWSERIDSRSHSKTRSPIRMQPSSSSVVVASKELCSPLDEVPASYLTRTSYRSRSPVAPSRYYSHSPVSEGSHSQSRSCLLV